MIGQVGEILWEPSADRVAGARITAFMRLAAARTGLDFPDYAALHAWSVADREAFWRLVWEFCGVCGDGPGDAVLEDPGPMPGARWFPEARLNYAENLLQGEPEETVLIFAAEDGRRRGWTRDRLRREAARVAAGLRADGVGPGDRVAGFLPNIPESVAAMLGAASLGAVWSSCSPDFGPQGVIDRLGQISPKVLFVTSGYFYNGRTIAVDETITSLRSHLDSLVRVVQVPYPETPANGRDLTPWPEYGDPQAPLTCERLPFDHPLFIMFSSGTTGLPKCMVHGVGGTLLQHLKEHQLHCDLGPGDRLFYYTTCGWMMWNWLVSGLASGAAIVLYEGSPVRPHTVLWDLAAEVGITVLGASARWIAACGKFGLRPAEEVDLGSLRTILSTGSPLAPESFDYVYHHVKRDVQLSSISGGTDIISCFALGCPVLPVRRGELQCKGLGMRVEVFNADGRPVTGAKGELVCTAAFPSMPVGFWNDPDGAKYHQAYFTRYEGIWCHGDFAEVTPSGGLIIHGRSDTVLNPGGVRIGTAEIYRVVDRLPEVAESLVVGQKHGADVRVLLFVVPAEGVELTPELARRIRDEIRSATSPRHAPARIMAVPAVPRTRSGKLMETAVRRILEGLEVDNIEAVANPEAMVYFRELARSLN